MDVAALLGHHHLVQQLLGADGVPHPETGGDDFGEGTAVADDALGVHGLDGGDVGAGEPQVPVGVILQDHDARFFADAVHLLALLQGHSDAGGVLEVGDEVEEFCPGLIPDGGLQPVDGDAVLLHVDAHQLGPAGAEGVEGPDEGGIFAEDGIPLVHQALGSQLDGLLGPAGDDAAVPLLHQAGLPPVGELLGGLPQLGVALGNRILEGGGGVVFKDDASDVLQFLHREGVLGGVAPGKGDDGRVAHVFEDLPNGGGLHSGHSL